MNRLEIFVIASLFYSQHNPAPERSDEVYRYLRPTPKGTVPESTFTLKRTKTGWTIHSITRRGDLSLTVASRYDAEDQLLGAEAILEKGQEKSTAVVMVAGRKAKVQRPGQAIEEFGIPPKVIVTSAPDWSDIFLLCRHYDRAKAGKQTFTGLWIHPTQPALLLPFSIERTGSKKITLKDQEVTLYRYQITIRGPTPYVAWADEKGNLIRLEGALVLEGHESVSSGRPGGREGHP